MFSNLFGTESYIHDEQVELHVYQHASQCLFDSES
jgi:hypothetical protein